MLMLGHYPHRLDEAQWPELLKMVQADAIAKLQAAGIPVEKSGDARLVIVVPMDEPNSSISYETEVELLQRVRLWRDPSIETDAVTWSREGIVHVPRPRDAIRQQIAGLIDVFIQDYLSVNPKQSANSTKQKSRFVAK